MRKTIIINFIVFLLFTVGVTQWLLSADIYGVITDLTGKVRVQLRVDLRWGPAKKGQALREDTKIETGSNGTVEIVFEDGSVLRAENNTIFSIKKAREENNLRRFLIHLIRGRITSNVMRIGDTEIKYEIRTPVSISGVRGSIFIVEHEKDKSNVAVFEGEVSVQSIKEVEEKEEFIGTEVIVEQGEQTSILLGEPALKPHPIEERLMRYYKKIVQKFNQRVEEYRKNMDEIHRQRIEWMEKQKKKYEDKMREDRQKYEKKLEELKKKHRLK